MLGLPLWVFQLLIVILQKTGAINTAETLIAKGTTDALAHIEKLKTYQQYPTGKNGQ